MLWNFILDLGHTTLQKVWYLAYGGLALASVSLPAI